MLYMKTIAFANFKGGVGKTTLSVHYAAQCHRKKHRVALLDRDPQAAASSWATSLGFPVFSDLKEPLAAVVSLRRDAGDEFCVVDTPPSLGGAFRDVARLADLLLIPARPSILDVRAVLKSLTELRTIAPDARIYCVLTQVNEGHKLTREAIEGLDELKIPVLASRVHMRTGYARAALDGTAFEHEEMDQLSREISNLLNV